MNEAARLLRHARKRAGLTQRALAATAGVPRPYVARVESSRTDPTVSSLSRLLRACETTLEALPGSGTGIDRTVFRSMLARTPAERLDSLVADAGWAPLHPLAGHGVRFVLIGDRAAHLHGVPAGSADVDVCWSRDDAGALAAALTSLRARRRDGAGSVRTVPRGDDPVLLDTDAGPLDLHAKPLGTNGYADLAGAAQSMDLGGVTVDVASVDDLIRMKRAAGRPKDRVEVEILVALRDTIAEQ
jgi:transcriptional regulator with XRE-family HTH domain